MLHFACTLAEETQELIRIAVPFGKHQLQKYNCVCTSLFWGHS